MHPILAHPGRLGLYLGAWLLPVSGLLTTLLTVSGGLPRLQALALAIPLSLVYAFVCLASWYPSRALPTDSTRFLEIIATHALAASISSGMWLLAGLAWSILLDRLPWFHNTFRDYDELLVLFFVVGVLLYVFAVVANYLLIASEASREAESRNLELQVQTHDAELRAVKAQRDQEFAERELERERSIQRRLLPPAEVKGEGYLVAARYVPANFLAGDFYDVFRLDDDRLGLVVADVAGKGIGASLITASVKAMTPLIAADHDLIETVHRLNDKLCGELDRREFVAFSIAILQLSSGELEVANCGLPDPYWITKDRKAEIIDVPGSRLPLGVRRDVVYENRKLQLQAGDRFLLLTDGLPEALTPQGEPLGYEALMKIVDRPQSFDDDPSAWLDRLLEEVTRATTTENDDDLTALMLKRCPIPNRALAATRA